MTSGEEDRKGNASNGLGFVDDGTEPTPGRALPGARFFLSPAHFPPPLASPKTFEIAPNHGATSALLANQLTNRFLNREIFFPRAFFARQADPAIDDVDLEAEVSYFFLR